MSDTYNGEYKNDMRGGKGIMLQPGEFVIKKSSVNKMGAGTLAAMNSNKMAGGTPKGGAKAQPQMTRPQGFQLVRDGLLRAGYSKKSALQMANKFKLWTCCNHPCG